MPNHIMQTVIVTGINSDEQDHHQPITLAYVEAKTLFDPDLISARTPVGHNFVQSFCVFPTGSGTGREPQNRHQQSIATFVAYLKTLGVEYVAVKWTDSEDAIIEHTSEKFDE